MSEFNTAFSYNYHNAIAGTPPDYRIDFTKALVRDVINFSGETIQTWIAFLSEDGKEASNSIYTGELNVA